MKNSKMAGINPTLSVIILNVSGVNTLIKRQRLAELSKKRAPTTCCSQNRYFRFKDTKQLKVKEWKRQEMMKRVMKDSQSGYTGMR